MASQMIVRVPDNLKSKVVTLTKAEGKNVSAVVRTLLENYVRDRDISSYIDDLWDRTGAKLKAKGVKSPDIQKAIKKVRGGK